MLYKILRDNPSLFFLYRKDDKMNILKGEGIMTKKKWIILILSIVIVVAGGIGGYIWYQNDQKQKILDSIQLTFTDQTVIEYGSDVKAEAFVDKQSGKLTVPSLDTMKIGKQTLEYKVSKGELSKTFSHEIEVKDTQLPEIKLTKESVTLDYGDQFDMKKYIESVRDKVDGDLTYVSQDKVKDDQNNYYTYESNVNTKKAGTYKVVLKAVDKNQNKAEKTLKVTVKEEVKEEVIKPQSSSSTTTSSSSSSKQYVASPNNKVIVIDPGHQGQGNSSLEPIGPGASTKKAKVAGGATGTSTGIPESQTTLEIGLKLRNELQSRGYTVIMTRTSQGVNISNKERAMIGNNNNAAAVIHLHCDGAGSSARGAHTIAPASDNPYCSSIYSASSRLAQNVISSYCAKTGIKSRGVSYRNDLSGLNWSEVPAIYIEMGFITNPTEDQLLNDDAFQTKCAQGIADGIDAYF